MTATDTHAAPVELVGPDPGVEAWLESHHVRWEFQARIGLDEINHGASLANQARLEPLDGEVVDRYAADMERGDRFPPIIARRRGRSKLLVLGGNHRCAAARSAKVLPALAGYVVECTDETALLLMYEDNRRHGLPPSQHERVLQAIHLIDNGMEQNAAARAVGIPKGSMSYERAIIRAGRRAADFDIKGFDALAKTVRYQLSLLRTDPVFVETAKLTVAARLTLNEVKSLVARVTDARSDADALQLLGSEADDMRERIQAGAGGKLKQERTARAKFRHAATTIVLLTPGDLSASCPTQTARIELRGELKRLGEHLARIAKAL